MKIPSANPDFKELPVPTSASDTGYLHPADRRANHPIPMAFQVTSPFNTSTVLLPHSLVLHINPSSFNESFNQKIERFQTRGGFQEQHWGQDLTEISADASTGAFVNIYTGVTSVLRHRTIAWDRYRDLHDLYLNNGSVHDPFGNIVLQGQIMLMYDRGVYLGTFRGFEVEETDDSPFAFKLSWSFKVETTLMSIPVTIFDGIPVRAPAFQSQNNLPADREDLNAYRDQQTEVEADQQAEAEKAADWRRERNAEISANVEKAEQQAAYEEATEKFDPLAQTPEQALGIGTPSTTPEGVGSNAVKVNR